MIHENLARIQLNGKQWEVQIFEENEWRTWGVYTHLNNAYAQRKKAALSLLTIQMIKGMLSKNLFGTSMSNKVRAVLRR